MNTLKKSAFLLVALVLLCSSMLVTQAQENQPTAGAAADSVNGLVLTKTISANEQKAALAFWNRKAIAAAQPLELLADAGPAEVDFAALAEAEATGPVGFVPSGLAAPGADRAAQAAYPLDWAALGLKGNAAMDEGVLGPEEPSAVEGTSQVYTSYIVNQYSPMQTIYPHKWIGRLSFSTSGGTSYCSATAISGNVMLTAAHCVYDTTYNRFYSRWVFTPAYRNGSAPYGSFAATQCAVLTAWVNLSGGYSINSWTKYDVAVCKMGRNSAGQTLNYAVGWMGREWNYSYIRHFHNLGYPFQDYRKVYLTDAGKYLRTCVAETFQQSTEVRGMGCNLGGGISGGPWVRGYAPNVVSGWASGVNSGIYVGVQNIYGARFNSSNIVPLCTWAGC